MILLYNPALPLTAADLAGLGLLMLAWFATSRVVEHPPAGRPSVSVLMKRYRREWMGQFIHRDPRIFDGNILSSLRQSTSFYASACMLAIGGGLALIGNTDPLAGLARDLDAAEIPDVVWKIKLLLVLLFVANAFMKFVWAHRLFGYCEVMMGAVPVDPDHPQSFARAMSVAEVNINAARNFNTGLRAVYFSLGAVGWLAGPWGLVLGVVVVTTMTLRREFASGSRQAILRDLPD